MFDTLKKVTNELEHYEALLMLYAKEKQREALYQKHENEATKALIKELREME